MAIHGLRQQFPSQSPVGIINCYIGGDHFVQPSPHPEYCPADLLPHRAVGLLPLWREESMFYRLVITITTGGNLASCTGDEFNHR